MRILSTIFWLLILILAITFASLNAHSVDINYYLGKKAIFLPILLLITLIFGAALGILAMLPISLKSKREARRAQKALKKCQQQTSDAAG